MQKQQNIWGKHEGKTNQLIRLESGSCCLQLKHISGGWAVIQQKCENIVDETTWGQTPHNEKLADANIYQTGRSNNLFIQPALPLKPVVFKSSKKIIIRPHQSLRLFIAVPLYIQLYYKQVDAEHLLAEFETERLSDTWFGEPDAGSPAFSVGSRFETNLDEVKTNGHEIIVPVHISNNSSQLLDLQRLLIHVELMNLYLVGSKMISDMGTIEFKGPGQVSHLNFSVEKTLHGSNPIVLGKARQAANRNILGHSFHFIKQMTQL